MTQPEKLDLRAHDVAGDKMNELLRLFPEIATEGSKLDCDRLKLALGNTVNVGKERYGKNGDDPISPTSFRNRPALSKCLLQCNIVPIRYPDDRE
jgi:hypothetical protein